MRPGFWMALFALTACQSAPKLISPSAPLEAAQNLQFAAMGTTWILEYRSPSAMSVIPSEIEALFQRELKLYDETFSDWSEDSELRRLESQGLDSPSKLKASPLFVEGLDFANQAYRLSDGLFDITIGAVVWKERSRPVGMVSLELDRESQRFRFGVNPVRLTFGGIAKGMVIGAIAAKLWEGGVKDFRIEGGGGNSALAGSYLDLLPEKLGFSAARCEAVYFVARSAPFQGKLQHILDPRAPKNRLEAKSQVICRSCLAKDFEKVGAFSDAFSKPLVIEERSGPPDMDCQVKRL